VASYDGFVFVIPEHNHSTTPALKNALDYLFREWTDKACAFVSFGLHGGVRAVEHLRQIAGELAMADVRAQVALSLFHDFVDMEQLAPDNHHVATLHRTLDQLIRWAGACRPSAPCLRQHEHAPRRGPPTPRTPVRQLPREEPSRKPATVQASPSTAPAQLPAATQAGAMSTRRSTPSRSPARRRRRTRPGREPGRAAHSPARRR
jgi:hypothetical protein